MSDTQTQAAMFFRMHSFKGILFTVMTTGWKAEPVASLVPALIVVVNLLFWLVTPHHDLSVLHVTDCIHQLCHVFR